MALDRAPARGLSRYQGDMEMSPAKICLMTETYPPVLGGGEVQSRLLATALARRGHPVMVLTRRSDAGLPKRETVGGVEVVRLPPAGEGQLKKWGMLLSAFLALIRRRRRWDLVMVSGYRVLGLPAVAAARLAGRPCVLKADTLGEMSGEIFSRGLRKLGLGTNSRPLQALVALRARLLRRAAAFVAISAAVERELLEHRVAADRLQRIPNAVDIESFRPADGREKASIRRRLGLPAEAPIVVYTGRLVSYKGLPLLLRVWRDLAERRRGALLLLVGSGSLDIGNCEDELRAYVANESLEGSVRFAGDVEDVASLLQASDVLVLPSEREAFGVSVIEAMACGLAVIASDVGGLGEIVSDRIDGLVVEAGDREQLAAGLDSLLSDGRLRARLGAAARQAAVERYAVAEVVETYVALFEDLVER